MNTATTAIDDLSMEQLATMSDEDLLKLENGETDQQATEKGVTENSQTQDGEAGKESEKTQEGESTTTTEEVAAGVATKAGDKIIPYSVLEQTRNDKTAAEKRATELEQKNLAAENKVKELTEKLASIGNGNLDDADLLSDEELDAMAEEMPETAQRLRAIQNKFAATALSIKQRDEDLAKQRQQDAMARAAQESQAAIDDVPKLAYIQAHNPRLYRLAVNIDAELREKAKSDPEIAKLSLKERFERVVNELETDLGIEIQLDGGKKELTKASPKPAAPPLSISDLNGGSTVNDEQDAVDETSTQVSLIDKMSKMTPKQLDEFLST